jgi:hypothetical protein
MTENKTPRNVVALRAVAQSAESAHGHDAQAVQHAAIDGAVKAAICDGLPWELVEREKATRNTRRSVIDLDELGLTANLFEQSLQRVLTSLGLDAQHVRIDYPEMHFLGVELEVPCWYYNRHRDALVCGVGPQALGRP